MSYWPRNRNNRGMAAVRDKLATIQRNRERVATVEQREAEELRRFLHSDDHGKDSTGPR